MAASTPYPIRLTDGQRVRLAEAAKAVGLSLPETMRQAIAFGLPVLVKRLAKKPA